MTHLCMKRSLDISNFLEELSSLSHSIVCLYFFALITEEVFLISPCSSLEHHIHIQCTSVPGLCFSFLPEELPFQFILNSNWKGSGFCIQFPQRANMIKMFK